MTKHAKFFVILAVLIFSLPLSCVAAGLADSATPLAETIQKKMPPPPPLRPVAAQDRQNAKFPMLEKVAPGMFRLGAITIHKQSASISFPAVVNMDKGLLEYVLVSTGGKTHESLLRTDVDPADLQIALLLLGLEGTDRPLARQGAPERPQGNPVELTINYLQDKKMVRLGAEEWLVKKAGDVLEKSGPLDWVFTGSVIRDGRFLGKVEGSIIALYHDPVALVDNASPGGESDKIWHVSEAAVLPVGTPVTIVINAKQ